MGSFEDAVWFYDLRLYLTNTYIEYTAPTMFQSGKMYE